MKRFKIERSESDIISHSGLTLIGQAVKRYTTLSGELTKNVPLRHGTSHADILKTYLGLLSIGKNDFEAINTIESINYFCTALDIDHIPSEATLRQRMNQYAETFLPIVEKAGIDFLCRIKPDLKPLSTGHIPLDADVTPMDNSGSHEEGVGRTYKNHDGYAPMATYLGQEGYCLGMELRPGTQHCQKDTPALLKKILKRAQRITTTPLLLRLDGGNDAIENIEVIFQHNESHGTAKPIDFLIKWNPRKQDKQQWLETAEQKASWEYPREGKRVGLFSLQTHREWQGYEYSVRQVIRITERTIDKHGQMLLEPDITLEGWWTSLYEEDELAIIQLYADHGTSEQFHSEFKTDLDIERLPSGKFATNALVLGCSVLIFNILRWIGQNGLLGSHSPKRNKAKRRRIKTVMQELMYLAARVIKSGRRVKLSFGRGCRGLSAFEVVYQRLVYS